MENKLKCTNCFKSLGVSSRMSIYNFLEDRGKATVMQITKRIKLRQPTISYHLKEMKEQGLLSCEKHGKEVIYKVTHLCPHYDSRCILDDIKFPVTAKVQNVKN